MPVVGGVEHTVDQIVKMAGVEDEIVSAVGAVHVIAVVEVLMLALLVSVCRLYASRQICTSPHAVLVVAGAGHSWQPNVRQVAKPRVLQHRIQAMQLEAVVRVPPVPEVAVASEEIKVIVVHHKWVAAASPVRALWRSQLATQRRKGVGRMRSRSSSSPSGGSGSVGGSGSSSIGGGCG